MAELGANFTNKPWLRFIRVASADELQSVLVQVTMPYTIESIYHEPDGSLVCWINPSGPLKFVNKKSGVKKS